ncbi:MAG TPA: M24 family metallopeptidase [Solirubrobacteraceae bacterium]|nr:M24 family metallopeptidase [Solirubrobacteraceae bacterium]
MPDLLLYGDTEHSAALRHEIPVAICDAFLYGEVGGRAYVMTWNLERARVAAARPDAALVEISDLGFHELLGSGMSREEVEIELVSRAAKRIGVRAAVVDFDFPLGIAERLRADGIVIAVDEQTVSSRRRRKSDGELSGIRRAQAAAEAGITAAADLLRAATATDGTLYLDGEPLLAERVRTAMRDACWRMGALLGSQAIVASVWQGVGHEPGSGPLPAGLPIQIDLWPQDEASACWADMTRTFVVGAPRSEEVSRQERLVRAALEGARDRVRPGVTGADLHAVCCEIFEAAGYRTQRTGPGENSDEGFQFSLGHGVGLRVHEEPGLGVGGRAALVAGDVIAIEPGLWDGDVGGVRFEDLLLVTADGCETLTSYPYDLSP